MDVGLKQVGELVSKLPQALNSLRSNDFRLATASSQPNALVPWRQRAAEAARAAAGPYLRAQRHWGHTVPALQREAAAEASEEKAESHLAMAKAAEKRALDEGRGDLNALS